MPLSLRSFRSIFWDDYMPFNLEHLRDVRVVCTVQGPLERCGPRWDQCGGLDLLDTNELLAATNSHGSIPRSLRMAHSMACGVGWGESRGRP